MKNLYANYHEASKEYTIVYCEYKGETIGFIIDNCDLPKVQSVGSWNILKKPNGSMYVQGRIGKDRVLLHRFLTDAPADKIVDHKDGNGLRNIRENLRVTTQNINRRNLHKTSNSTGVVGVYPNGTKYRAKIRVNKKSIDLGTYDTIEQATKARKEAEIKYWGQSI